MKTEFGPDRSIYLQIAESIEDDILQGVIPEEEQVPSTNQMAALYRINPATAAKGINKLVDEGILYKRRGIGMFVTGGAIRAIRQKRKEVFYDSYIRPLLDEAATLGFSKEDIAEMLSSAGERAE